jgi:hypothetical protein
MMPRSSSAMAANRLRRASSEQDDGAITREFRLNRHVNSLFTAILRAEIGMTLAGMKWPAGGSRVVAARSL